MQHNHKFHSLTVYTLPCPGDRHAAGKALDILTGLVSIAGFVCAMGVLVVIS